MSNYFDDIPEYLHGEKVITYSVELCKNCNGLGYRFVEEGRRPSNYCGTCDGDGRVLKKSYKIYIEYDEDEETVPFTLSKDIYDIEFTERKYLRYKLDRTDRPLERKYPNLASLTYENYDKELEKCKVIEALKGNDNDE